MIPTTIEDAIKELYYWQHSYTHCFSNLVFDLIQKADGENQQRLMKAFPTEVMVWGLWHNANDPDKFFEEHLGKDFGSKERPITKDEILQALRDKGRLVVKDGKECASDELKKELGIE